MADGGMWLLSHMPLGVLYPIGYVVYILMYYVVGYRKKVVKKNLSESFPDMTEKELRLTMKDFYLNFADYIVETVRLGGISEREITSRVSYENLE